MKELYLDKYDIFDKWGYGKDSKEGIWRPLDIINGLLAVQGSDQAPKRYEIEAQQKARQLREYLDGIEFKHARKGRPRKAG